MHDVVDLLLDDGQPHLELQPRWAPNVVTVLGRLQGRAVGILANNPSYLAGCLDVSGSEKAAAFVERCDAFGIPIAVLARRAGLPARTRSGGRGDRVAWGQAAAGLRRGTGPAGDGDHAQGVRRCVHRHELEVTGCRRGLRLARSRGRRDVPHRGGRDPAPQADRHDRTRPPCTAAGLLAREYEAVAGGLQRALACGHVDRVIDPSCTKQVLDAAFSAREAPEPRPAVLQRLR